MWNMHNVKIRAFSDADFSRIVLMAVIKPIRVLAAASWRSGVANRKGLGGSGMATRASGEMLAEKLLSSRSFGLVKPVQIFLLLTRRHEISVRGIFFAAHKQPKVIAGKIFCTVVGAGYQLLAIA
jgi:hypothetical protein